MDDELGGLGLSRCADRLTNQLNTRYQLRLAPTIFFEHRTEFRYLAEHGFDAWASLEPSPYGRLTKTTASDAFARSTKYHQLRWDSANDHGEGSTAQARGS